MPALSADKNVTSALLLIDVQVGFLTGNQALPRAEALIESLALLLEKARRANIPIIHLQNDATLGNVDEPHTPGWELYFEVRPSSRECILRKTGDDGFETTQLDKLLRQHGVKRLVIGGLLSEMCVSATARTALAKGYSVVLPCDAHGTYDLGEIPASVVARVAEHALGDDLEVAQRSSEVTFETAARNDEMGDGL